MKGISIYGAYQISPKKDRVYIPITHHLCYLCIDIQSKIPNRVSFQMIMDLDSLPILMSGRGWIVVDKPSGVSVEEKWECDLCSVVQSRIGIDANLGNRIDCDPRFGIHPVHRLDRETSGIILLACRPEIFRYFALQFERRKVRKRYIALLHGQVDEALEEEGWGKWSWPLSQDAGGRLHPEGTGTRVPCETGFRILRRSNHYTLLECELVTGRKHQIRRHARLAGHPVVGDSRYGTPRSIRFIREEMRFARLALHSFSLQIVTPGSEALQVFQSSAIPGEILRLLDEDEKTG